MKKKKIEKMLAYLREGNDGRLHCPRCGWVEGKLWHCGLCEGHEENIIDWYIKQLFGRE